jgi:hypothetical protein
MHLTVSDATESPSAPNSLGAPEGTDLQVASSAPEERLATDPGEVVPDRRVGDAESQRTRLNGRRPA